MKHKMAMMPSVIVVFLALGAGCYAQSSSGGGRLAGTWDASITILNCATGATINSFQSIANFNTGGTFTGITSGIPPSMRSPEIGRWRHESGNVYKFRFKAYLFNPEGAAVGYQIVTHSLELASDNESYTSSGGVVFYDVHGTPTGTGCSSAIGSRMPLD